jgi:serine/threonine-protein kinase
MSDSTHPAGGGLGWSLGPYQIINSIGSGKFGTVYRATESPSGREVALKLVPLEGAESEEKVEAERLGAQLQQRFGQTHKGLVPEIFDHQPRASFYAIAMELVRGEPLRDVIARGPLAPRRAAETALAIARFLEHAHRFETDINSVHYGLIVHGDLKPDHILMMPNGEIRVLDFGIAKALAERTAVTTNKWGSMPYASPERLQSDGHVNEHADFWSLGVMLFEMVAGFRPYHRLEHNPSRLNTAIITHQPLEALPDGADPVLSSVIRKLLAPQIERRYPSAAAIADDLEACLAGRETVAGREDARASVHTVRIGGAGAAPPATTPVAPTTPIAAAAAVVNAAAQMPPRPLGEPVPTEPLPPPVAATEAVPGGRPGFGPPGVVPLPPRVSARRIGFGRVAKFAAACVLVAMVAAEGVALTRAERVRAQVAELEIADIPAAREDYERITEWSPLSIAKARVRGALVDRLVELADRTILEYRTERPAVAEVQWEQARQALDLAAEIARGSARVRSKLLYTTGHLKRITGRSVDDFEAAVADFEQSARLDPRSPDPYLGLARVYSLPLLDVKALEHAIREAEARGYKSGRRERAQLGDAYRTRGERARVAAARSSGEARTEQLAMARESYAKCVEYFDGLRFYSSDDNLRLCRRRLTQIEAALAVPAPLFVPPSRLEPEAVPQPTIPEPQAPQPDPRSPLPKPRLEIPKPAPTPPMQVPTPVPAPRPQPETEPPPLPPSENPILPKPPGNRPPGNRPPDGLSFR